MNTEKTQSTLSRAVPEIGDGADGFHPGTGKSDQNFVIVENANAGIEAALRADGRYTGHLAADGNTYYTTTGISTGTASKWNFDYSVVDFGGGSIDLSDYSIVISGSFVDYAGTTHANIMTFDPVAHAASTDEYYYQDPSGSTEGLQNSQNLSWAATDFDSAAPGTYTLTMTVTQKGTGEVVAAPEIKVQVAANITVGENGITTVQQAVDAATAGDTIAVPAGTYDEAVIIDKKVTLIGAQTAVDPAGTDRAGASETIIQGGIHLLDDADGTTIDGVTLSEGANLGGSKAGIYIDAGASSVTVKNTVFMRDDDDANGSGYRGILTVSNGENTDLTISQNSFSGWATGVYLNPGASDATVNDNTFDGNYVGISVDGPDGATINGNSFTNNAYEAIGLGPDSGSGASMTADLSYNSFGAGNGATSGEVIGVYDTAITVTDKTPSLSLSGPTSVIEGGSAGDVVYTLTLSQVSTRDTVVSWRTVDGSAVGGADFTATSAGSVTIKAGVFSGTVTVQVLGDSAVETDEAFSVEITGATYANLSASRSVGTTIVNDDSAPDSGAGSGDAPPEVVVTPPVSSGTTGSGKTNVVQTLTNTDATQRFVVSLVDSSAGGAANGVSAAIPAQVALTQEGSLAANTPGEAAADLTSFIERANTAPDAGETDTDPSVGFAVAWTQELDPAIAIDVRTITLQATNGAPPSEAIVITGSDVSDTGALEAFVLDVRQMPSGTSLELHNLDFASVAGEATIIGGSGANFVTADRSVQNILLGADNDTLYGGGGDDTVGSRGGEDILYGNQGRDVVFGGADNDTVYGGMDHDVVYGNRNMDVVYGNLGDDTLFGGQDVDVLFGGQHNDVIYGNLADDSLYGNKGNDTLFGGQGKDMLHGQNADDVLVGGGGADIFVLRAGDGNDRVADYAVGDRLRFETDGTDVGGLLDLTFTSDGLGNLVIRLDASAALTLIGIAPAQSAQVAIELVSRGWVSASGSLESEAIELIGTAPVSYDSLF